VPAWTRTLVSDCDEIGGVTGVVLFLLLIEGDVLRSRIRRFHIGTGELGPEVLATVPRVPPKGAVPRVEERKGTNIVEGHRALLHLSRVVATLPGRAAPRCFREEELLSVKSIITMTNVSLTHLSHSDGLPRVDLQTALAVPVRPDRCSPVAEVGLLIKPMERASHRPHGTTA